MPTRHTEVTGLLCDDVLVEWYRYLPGPAVVLPSHMHEEYQLNLNVEVPGGVYYRGAFHVVPSGQLAVVMPGEPHTPRDPADRDDVSTHLTIYVRPDAMREAATELAPKRTGLPAFYDLIVDDAHVVERFARVHAALSSPSPALDREVRLAGLLSDLVERYARVTPAGSPASAHRAVRRARDYLHGNFLDNVTLTRLSEIAELSRYRLARLFSEDIGLPPHAYQTQLRLEHAKRLLLAGTPVSRAGHEAGFFDLSHFTRHFKRYVGVPPGAYVRGAGPHR
jgi:AraC-like DNA-binding protein